MLFSITKFQQAIALAIALAVGSTSLAVAADRNAQQNSKPRAASAFAKQQVAKPATLGKPNTGLNKGSKLPPVNNPVANKWQPAKPLQLPTQRPTMKNFSKPDPSKNGGFTPIPAKNGNTGINGTGMPQVGYNASSGRTIPMDPVKLPTLSNKVGTGKDQASKLQSAKIQPASQLSKPIAKPGSQGFLGLPDPADLLPKIPTPSQPKAPDAPKSPAPTTTTLPTPSLPSLPGLPKIDLPKVDLPQIPGADKGKFDPAKKFPGGGKLPTTPDNPKIPKTPDPGPGPTPPAPTPPTPPAPTPPAPPAPMPPAPGGNWVNVVGGVLSQIPFGGFGGRFGSGYIPGPVYDAPVPVSYDAPMPQYMPPMSAGSADLVLEDVRMVEDATLVAGPAYAVRFRNQGLQACGSFAVTAFATMGQLTADAPRASLEVPSLGAGETREIVLRMPRAQFSHLAVAVDSTDAINELDEANNSAMIAR